MKTRLSGRRLQLDGELIAPSSKPETQRGLLLSLLSSRPNRLRNVNLSSETNLMFKALETIGLHGRLTSDTVLDSTFMSMRDQTDRYISIDAANSALVARCLAWFALAMKSPITINGGAILARRPFEPLLEQLGGAGGLIQFGGPGNIFPLVVQASREFPRTLSIDGSISSQFVTAPILGALAARRPTNIVVTGRKRSTSYIQQTVSFAQRFGADITYDVDDGLIKLAPGVPGGIEISVSTDFTSLSYYVAVLIMCGGRLSFSGYNGQTLQGEKQILDIFEAFGGHLTERDDVLCLTFDEFTTGPLSFDLSNSPNIAPTVVAMSACRPGRTIVRGVGVTTYHKSSRMLAMYIEMKKCGASLFLHQNEFQEYDIVTIDGGLPLKSTTFNDHSDHRIFMSLFALSLSIENGAEITHEDEPSTSNAQFFSDMLNLAVDFRREV